MIRSAPMSGRFPRALLLVVLMLFASGPPLWAHHFKGLPHYNYFENYPQVPEEEFLGQAGRYELSLVVYDFQGIQRENVEDPDNVRLFLVIFDLATARIYQGALTMEILDSGQRVLGRHFAAAELENVYSLHEALPATGRYSLRVRLHDEQDLECIVPFALSSQKLHWEKWIAAGLVLILAVAALGARKARVAADRREARRRHPPSPEACHAA